VRRLVRESAAIGRQEDGRRHCLYFGGPLCKSLDEIRVESVKGIKFDVPWISMFLKGHTYVGARLPLRTLRQLAIYGLGKAHFRWTVFSAACVAEVLLIHLTVTGSGQKN
jgi:hypothetical protein